MPKRCAVPNCNTGRKTDNEKHSFFRVPSDILMFKKWEAAIPGVIKLEPTQVVCEKHFCDKDIIREWIHRHSNGQIISRVPYKRPRLDELAVPSKFWHDLAENENTNTSHDYARSFGVANHFPRNPLDIEGQESVSGESAIFIKPSMQLISTMVEEFPEMKNISSCAASPAADDTLLLPKMEVNSSEADLPVRQMPFRVPSPVGISERIWDDGASSFTDLSVNLPESWSITDMPIENGRRILFSYSVITIDNGMECPLTEKYVTLDADRSLNYFVYGRPVKQQGMELNSILDKIEMLPVILTKFRRIPICSGLDDVDIHLVPTGQAYHDFMGKWRSKDCSLVCKNRRCGGCFKSRKCALQRKARLKNRPSMKRIRDVSNPIDRFKLAAMRIRSRRERRQKLRAKERVASLVTCIKEQAVQIASMQDTALDAKCAELNVPASQKTVLKEIIAAASRTNARGRRYNEEWPMLCMLMNIRSPGYYEFLRKNNINQAKRSPRKSKAK